MLSLDQGAYRISSREMWRDLKENEIDVSKSLDDISENKPRTRIRYLLKSLQNLKNTKRTS